MKSNQEKCCTLKVGWFLHGLAAIFHGTSTDIMRNTGANDKSDAPAYSMSEDPDHIAEIYARKAKMN